MWIIHKTPTAGILGKAPGYEELAGELVQIACGAQWKSLEDVRRTFPHADLVQVGSGKSATVFNVCGNKHRMATAIHYNTGKIFVLELMSHAEYSKNQWKDRL